jgi:hypothetical protein
MMSFDEFHSSNLRGKALENLRKTLDTNVDDEGNKNSAQDESFMQKKNEQKLFFLEMIEFQFVIIALLLLDTFLSYLLLLLLSPHIDKLEMKSDIKPIFSILNTTFIDLNSFREHFFNSFQQTNQQMLKLILDIYQLNSFVMIIKLVSILFLMIFNIEIIIIFLYFHISACLHIGYVIDFIIISIQNYSEMNYLIHYSKLLNFLRLWRLIRLFYSLLDIEKYQHHQTKNDLNFQLLKNEKLNLEINFLNDEIQKEKYSKLAMEKMLLNYKEENETLNEALKIAAMDIADVAQSDIDSNEDESIENDIKDDDDEDLDHSGISNDDIVFQDAHEETNDIPRQKKSSKRSDQDVTFVINEDGSYKKK